MSFLDRLIPGYDPKRKKELDGRLSGTNSVAKNQLMQARGQASRTAAQQASAGADAGLSIAAARRQAGQAQQQAGTAALGRFSVQRGAEVQAAQNELSQMREQRAGFMRNLLGQGLAAGGSIVSTLGIGGDEQTGGVQPSALGGLGDVGSLAGTALGGPLGAVAGQSAGGLVDQLFGSTPVSDTQLLQASPQPVAAPVSSGFMDVMMRQQGAPTQDLSGMTPEELNRWMVERGHRMQGL